MNIYQEALNVLHGQANGNLIREESCEYTKERNDEYAELLRELVEKSIPKSVELYQNEPGTIYNVICPNCGQAIKKWSDEA
ncbi:MAG TPA: hypothetical protein IAD15_09140 [Candidatus Fimiplasma intestinipullorum]|uniref:Uncharacterized protein n=1 Tax=Candidatus Fimiplasma intestinipullorum TaxID=2840825 RepID=A0A9D1L033_9FIRM|nr:hypothetical protein [Candidatus Fimiplasma intestinipullorum]